MLLPINLGWVLGNPTQLTIMRSNPSCPSAMKVTFAAKLFEFCLSRGFQFLQNYSV